MADPAEKLTFSLADRKLALEEKKVEIEQERLRIERLTAWTTGGSIVISLLIAALTISFGIWSQHEQVITQLDIQEKQAKAQLELGERTAKSQLEVEERNARSQFQIKAAEIVMNTDTPRVTRNKARALLALFPETLPSNFAQSFDPKQFGSKQQATTVNLSRTNPTNTNTSVQSGGGGGRRHQSVRRGIVYHRGRGWPRK